MARPTNTQFAMAVHVLTLLTASPDLVTSSETLAGSVGSNPVHIRRVLGRLREAGLVVSRPGSRGGWLVTTPAGEISLADVWRVVQGDDQVLGLHDANPECAKGQRIQRDLRAIDRRAAEAIERELATTTIADLVEDLPVDDGSVVDRRVRVT